MRIRHAFGCVSARPAFAARVNCAGCTRHTPRRGGGTRPSCSAAPAACDLVQTYLRSTREVAQFHTYERLFSVWHVLHVPLVYMLVLKRDRACGRGAHVLMGVAEDQGGFVRQAAGGRCMTARIFVALLLFAGRMDAEPVGRADSLESVLMPGKVIQGHAKTEGQCNKCMSASTVPGRTPCAATATKDVARDVAQKQASTPRGGKESRAGSAIRAQRAGRAPGRAG